MHFLFGNGFWTALLAAGEMGTFYVSQYPAPHEFFLHKSSFLSAQKHEWLSFSIAINSMKNMFIIQFYYSHRYSLVKNDI